MSKNTANFCPSCGRQRLQDERFCPSCGTELGLPSGGSTATQVYAHEPVPLIAQTPLYWARVWKWSGLVWVFCFAFGGGVGDHDGANVLIKSAVGATVWAIAAALVAVIVTVARRSRPAEKTDYAKQLVAAQLALGATAVLLAASISLRLYHRGELSFGVIEPLLWGSLAFFPQRALQFRAVVLAVSLACIAASKFVQPLTLGHVVYAFPATIFFLSMFWPKDSSEQRSAMR